MTGEPPRTEFGRGVRENQQSMPDEWAQGRALPRSPHDMSEATELGDRPRRSARARGALVRFFNFLLTVALVGAIVFVGLIWYGKTEFEAPGPLAEAKTYVVEPGSTFSSIMPDLEKAGIIPRQGPLGVFIRGVRASGKGRALKAGEFGFKPGMSMRDVMMELTEGRAIEYALTFPEGWTSNRIIERIAFDKTLVGDVPPEPPEGSLMPSTYSFPRGTTREQVIQRMQDEQRKALAKVWAGRVEGLPLKSPEELVILASIVEKETGVAGERAHVASVFINRLRKGMRLETDPTIIYGIWGGKGKPKDRGGLRRSEIDRKTAYNTYQIDGLPPTPIANPGLASMEAVANPLETDDLFFVADGTGGHAFAKTLKEHNANVAKWRKIEAQRKREAEAAAKAASEAGNEQPAEEGSGN